MHTTRFSLQDCLLIYFRSTIRFPQKTYTLWGLATSYKIFANGNDNKSSSSIGEEARFVGLNLTGPSLESWSTVISVDITKRQLEEKLRDFRAGMHLKRCSTGLITAPVIINEPGARLCYSDNHELVNTVKKIFPEVPFVGTFCEDEDVYFGVESMSDGKIMA